MRQGKIVDEYGKIEYYKDDQLHRDNDLPTVVWIDGNKWWHQNNILHRLAGPAIECADGEIRYYLYGKLLTKQQHHNHKEVKKYKLQQILNRALKDPT